MNIAELTELLRQQRALREEITAPIPAFGTVNNDPGFATSHIRLTSPLELFWGGENAL